MSEEFKKVKVVADLTVGTKAEKVVIKSLSMTGCHARLTFKLRPRESVVLRFYENQEENGFSSFKPVRSTVEWVRNSKADPKAFTARIKFNDTVKIEQGVVQILNPEKFAKDKKTAPVITTEKNSLRGVAVRCHMCAQDNIPFWVLRNRSMQTKANIFGVPSYVKAKAGQDFCDFNLIRVVVCPKCYFASSDIAYFQKPTRDEDFPKPPFNKGAIYKQWNDSIPERKQLVEAQLEGFFGENRTVEQALLAYDLGVITNDMVFKADEDKDVKRRNYDPARNAVSYLMFKAELLMSNNQREQAEKLLEEVALRLEAVFPYLNDEPSIRVGFLLGMLGLYLNDKKKIRIYLSFLREYNRDGKVKVGSSVYKTLVVKEKQLNEAYEDQDDYSKDNLKSFHKK